MRIHCLCIDLKKAYDSGRWEVLCSIVTEFGMRMKLDRALKVSVKGTYSKAFIGKYLSDTFYVQNYLKDCSQLCFMICHKEGPRKAVWSEIE